MQINLKICVAAIADAAIFKSDEDVKARVGWEISSQRREAFKEVYAVVFGTQPLAIC